MAFAPNGSAIATAGGDHTVRLWRPTGRELADLPASGGAVHGVAYSPDRQQVAAADDAGQVTVWDARSGEQVIRFAADPTKVYAVAYSPDGKVLATGGADGLVKLWDATLGCAAHRAPRPQPSGLAPRLCLRRLAAGQLER